MWTIPKIETLGFKLVSNHKLWCMFEGHDFEVLINLDLKYTKGNHFTFHSKPYKFKGNFVAEINTEEEFKTLLRLIK